MGNKGFIKRVSSLILIFAMLLSVLPGNMAYGEKKEPVENLASLKIVTFEDEELIDLKDKEFKENESALDFAKRLMDENKIAYVDGGGYLSSINNLAAFDKGQYSGWMTRVNGEMPDTGLGDIKVKKDDKIELFFVQNYNSLFNIGKGQVIVDGLEEKPLFTSEFVDFKENETALEFTKRILDENKIDYVDGGGYLTSIAGLSQLDKGEYSGWLAYVNDQDIEVGLNDIKAEDGIVVKLFFVENYNDFYGDSGDVEELFTDLEGFDWAKEGIEALAIEGIVEGTGDNSFSPKREVTRAEFATMLARLIKLDEVGENKFTDIKETDWYYKNIVGLANLGYIDGRPDGSFDPNGKITRQEIAKLVGQILKDHELGTEDEELIKEFTDYKDIGDWAKIGVASSVKEEIVNGSGGKFLPKKNANRAEAATMLYRLGEKIK